jgi:hypothetical protein
MSSFYPFFNSFCTLAEVFGNVFRGSLLVLDATFELSVF